MISWGFAEVLPDRVIVLAERGFLPAEIDRAAAEQERVAAREESWLDLSSHDPEFARRRSAARRVDRDDQRASRALSQLERWSAAARLTLL